MSMAAIIVEMIISALDAAQHPGEDQSTLEHIKMRILLPKNYYFYKKI